MLGRDPLGRDAQVALVLAILVVHEDDHAAGADLGEGLLDADHVRALAAGGHPPRDDRRGLEPRPAREGSGRSLTTARGSAISRGLRWPSCEARGGGGGVMDSVDLRSTGRRLLCLWALAALVAPARTEAGKPRSPTPTRSS